MERDAHAGCEINLQDVMAAERTYKFTVPGIFAQKVLLANENTKQILMCGFSSK